MRRAPLPPLLVTGAILSTALILAAYTARTSRAQDAAPAVVASPAQVVEQIMGLIGQGKIDDGVAMMEGLKNQPELREAVRGRLIRLRDDQGTYRGYDLAAIQRFTGQFQKLDVLAYYDDQPVLLRFHFYRPQKQDTVKWMVLGFSVTTELPEITEALKDTPVDYVGQTKR